MISSSGITICNRCLMRSFNVAFSCRDAVLRAASSPSTPPEGFVLVCFFFSSCFAAAPRIARRECSLVVPLFSRDVLLVMDALYRSISSSASCCSSDLIRTGSSIRMMGDMCRGCRATTGNMLLAAFFCCGDASSSCSFTVNISPESKTSSLRPTSAATKSSSSSVLLLSSSSSSRRRSVIFVRTLSISKSITGVSSNRFLLLSFFLFLFLLVALVVVLDDDADDKTVGAPPPAPSSLFSFFVFCLLLPFFFRASFSSSISIKPKTVSSIGTNTAGDGTLGGDGPLGFCCWYGFDDSTKTDMILPASDSGTGLPPLVFRC
mmetsp:Transcript_34395/g.51051  ORF Transcript_34395/g.51051 Transcript_34395/m.51051 type:complete len:320 (-) Transcript_34395:94-1053(-)